MKAEEEIAAWCGKALVAIAAFLVVAMFWVFTQIVRIGTQILINIAIERAWIVADPEIGEAPARLAGAAVGAVVGVVVCLTIVANGGPPVAGAVVVGAGALMGAVIAPVEADPWRTRPLGWVVDDWLGDDRD